jgi:hypothetical protein
MADINSKKTPCKFHSFFQKMLPVQGRSWADLCDEEDYVAPVSEPQAQCQIKWTTVPRENAPRINKSPWKPLVKPDPILPEPIIQKPEEPWTKVTKAKPVEKTRARHSPWQPTWKKVATQGALQENVVSVQVMPVVKMPSSQVMPAKVPTPQVPTPATLPEVQTSPHKEKPRVFSRRQLLRRVFADKYEEERQQALRQKRLFQEVRVAIRCLAFVQHLTKKWKLKQLQKKVAASARQRLIKKRLQLWVYNYRTKVYLSMVACCGTHLWLEKNCLRHFFTTIKYLLHKHPRRVPQETQVAMNILDEITTFRHVFVDKSTPQSMVGQMTQTLKHYVHNTKRLADLNVHQVIGRHFRSPQITQMLKYLVPSVDRHGWFWRKIMDATLRYAIQVPLKSGQNPDWILRSALMQVPAPKPTDLLAKMWSNITSLPVYYGFPAQSDKPEDATFFTTTHKKEEDEAKTENSTPIIPLYQEFRHLQDLSMEAQQELAKIRHSLYEKQVELEHCKKQLASIGGPVWFQRVSRLQELTTHLEDRSKRILAQQSHVCL